MGTPDWNKLFDDLRKAKGALESAQIEVSAARSRETAAINDVNRAQGAINKAIQEEKKTAPRESDWHREAYPPRSVTG